MRENDGGNEPKKEHCKHMGRHGNETPTSTTIS
jgi:hypothetical protein